MDFDAAQDEWDQVKEIVPQFRDTNVVPNSGGGDNSSRVEESAADDRRETALITSELAVAHFSRSIVERPSTSDVMSRLRRRGLLGTIDLCCGLIRLLPGRPEERILDEMSLVMALTQTPFDDGDPVCLQMTLTLYKQLTGDKVDCPRFGSHWEQIGFQGADPATDLRGVGLLGLLQPLFLLTTPEIVPFAQRVFKISTCERQNFPLMVLSINLTRIAFDALKDGKLNRLFKSKDDDFWYNFNFFYSAVLFYFYNIWKTQHKTIKDSGYVLKDTEKYCRNNVVQLVKDFSLHLLTYSVDEKQAARDNLNRRAQRND